MSKSDPEAYRFADEFVADPDKRAQVKVSLVMNGQAELADMIDEAVSVSRELIRVSGDMATILQTACDADEADPRELLSEIAAIARKYPWPPRSSP